MCYSKLVIGIFHATGVADGMKDETMLCHVVAYPGNGNLNVIVIRRLAKRGGQSPKTLTSMRQRRKWMYSPVRLRAASGWTSTSGSLWQHDLTSLSKRWQRKRRSKKGAGLEPFGIKMTSILFFACEPNSDASRNANVGSARVKR